MKTETVYQFIKNIANNIIDLDIFCLEHHPKNPRQDLGDLTELADSIREKGVLQNLTVVPNDHGTYYVVIGNRRLEAAKMAGLESLPVVIRSDMSEAEQQAVMLLENMQRNDLDPYEQAHGFQMCLDLGMTEDDLKKETGFSKKTIRHRLNLLKLDHDKFKKGVERGATLQDYIDLEQIKDEKVKDEVLKSIGTRDFRYNLNLALENQKIEKLKAKVIEKLQLQGIVEVDKQPEGYGYFKCFYGKHDYKEFLKEEPLEKAEEYCFRADSTFIYLYKKRDNEQNKKLEIPVKKEPTEEEKAKEKIILKANAAYQARLEFVQGKMKELPTDIQTLYDLSSFYMSIKEKLIDTSYMVYFEKNFEVITGNSAEDRIKKPETAKEMIRLLFALIYSEFELNDSSNILEPIWRGSRCNEYRSDQKEPLESYYQWLESFGYAASEEEKQIMFGTHPLYGVKNGK